MEGWVELVGWFPGYTPGWFSRLKTVIHPSTNRAWRWLTSLLLHHVANIRETGDEDRGWDWGWTPYPQKTTRNWWQLSSAEDLDVLRVACCWYLCICISRSHRMHNMWTIAIRDPERLSVYKSVCLSCDFTAERIAVLCSVGWSSLGLRNIELDRFDAAVAKLLWLLVSSASDIQCHVHFLWWYLFVNVWNVDQLKKLYSYAVAAVFCQ